MLLVVTAALAVVCWYLQPGRAVATTTTLLVLTGMAAALALAPRLAGRSADEAARRHAIDTVRGSVVLAALMLAISLGARSAVALGALDRADGATQVTMVLAGAFLVFTGNSMPKALKPLSTLQCDPAAVQAFQRLSGWTWVLAGLGLSISWLVLPAEVAQPVSLTFMAAAILVVLTQVVRLRRTHRKEA